MNVKPSYMLTAITAVDKPHVQSHAHVCFRASGLASLTPLAPNRLPVDLAGQGRCCVYKQEDLRSLSKATYRQLCNS